MCGAQSESQKIFFTDGCATRRWLLHSHHGRIQTLHKPTQRSKSKSRSFEAFNTVGIWLDFCNAPRGLPHEPSVSSECVFGVVARPARLGRCGYCGAALSARSGIGRGSGPAPVRHAARDAGDRSGPAPAGQRQTGGGARHHRDDADALSALRRQRNGDS